jgi:hypothetical protein
MVKQKPISAEGHDMLDFQERPDCAVQFSSLVTLGRTIQHSVVSAEGQMNVSMTRQPLKCDRGMHCLHFSNAWLFGYH